MTRQESQELKTYLEQRFDGVDRRLDKVDQRLDKVDQRLDKVDQRLEGMDHRLDGMDQRFDGVNQRLDKIDVHLDRQDADFNGTTKNLLLTTEEARKDARRYASRLFGILDRPTLETAGAPKVTKPRRSTLPRARSGR